MSGAVATLPLLIAHDDAVTGARGLIVLVSVADAARPDDVDEAVAVLPEAERALAAPWHPRRQATFAAGRTALRRALAEVGVDVDVTAPIARNDRGAPVVSGLPRGVAVSVTHKDTIAGALVMAGVGDAHTGVDVEVDELRHGRPRARADVDALIGQTLLAEEVACLPNDDDARRLAFFARFSAKEALYKAIDPFVRRYVGFLEVRADVDGDDVRFTVPEPSLAARGRVVRVSTIDGVGDVVLTTAIATKR